MGGCLDAGWGLSGVKGGFDDVVGIRVRRTRELLTYIQSLKMYGWELLFTSWLMKTRSLEVKYLSTRKYLDAWCVFFWATTLTLFSLFTFGLYVMMGNELDAATVINGLIDAIYAAAADMVLIMDKGQVKWVGSPADCSSSTYASFILLKLEEDIDLNHLQYMQEKDIGTMIRYAPGGRLVLRVEKKMYVIEQPLPAAPATNSEANVLLEWNAIYDAYNEIKGYVDQLEHLGYMLPQDLVVGLILNDLTKDFAEFVRNYNMHNMGKTIGELRAMLIEYEKGLPKKADTPQGSDKQVYIPKPKNPKPSAKEHPAKDDACHHCKEVGHWKKNCPMYLAELLNKKKQIGSATSSVSKNNVHYFNDIPSNGIYEIDMHNLVPNVNSIYNVSTKRAKHNLDSTYLWHCRLAHISKMTRKSFPHRLERATDLLGIIHTDVCGPLRHVSRQACVIVQHLTPPYTPQHNGVSERRNRTLLDMVRSMMNLTTLPLSFWDYALESTTRILNMVPTKKVDKTPYELWYGKVLNLSYLKVWGCEALVKRDTPDKLQQRSVKCIFIGYPKEIMGYYLYFPPENKIVVARYAEFFEKNLITQEVSGRDMDLEEIHDEDTSPSEITSEIPMEVEGFEPPQKEDIPIRRSERTRRAPNRLSLNVEAEEHSLGDLNELTSYKSAMLDFESNKWIDAMNAEIQSMMDNMVWVLVDLPPGCKTVRIYDAYNEVACLILGSMTVGLHRQFENSSPYDMIKELKAMFEKQAGVERFDLIQTFHACKQEQWKPVVAYVIQMKGYVDQLERLGYVLPHDVVVGFILNGLTTDFSRIVKNYNMHNMGKIVGELHAMLIEYEKGLPKKAETPQVMMIKGGKIQKANKKSLKAKGKGKANGKGKDKQVYIPKPKNPKPSTKEHPAKDNACHHCKEVGHWKRNCLVYLVE
ncbi:retrotransposon protein, putative, ty1-copia subclass [Tanacetum coccineum]